MALLNKLLKQKKFGTYLLKRILREESNINGVIVPAETPTEYDRLIKAIIVQCSEDCKYKEGDEVTVDISQRYNVNERVLEINNVDYYLCIEPEVLVVNSYPTRGVVVEKPINTSTRSATGMIIPNPYPLVATIIHSSSDKYKEGDTIQYVNVRRPSIKFKDKECYVIPEPDIFIHNKDIAEDYIFVEIDLKALAKRREQLESGIFLHPNFIFMKRNLQYAKIVAIGKNAPDCLKVGEYIAMHHKIEDKNYNNFLINKKFENSEYTHEIKAIHLKEAYRLIWGSFKMPTLYNQKLKINPYNIKDNEGNDLPEMHNIFYEWDIEPIINAPDTKSNLIEVRASIFEELASCKSLPSFSDIISKAITEYINKSNVKIEQLKNIGRATNPLKNSERDIAEEVDTQLERIKIEAEKYAQKLKANYLFKCKIAFISEKTSEYIGKKEGDIVLTRYKELYPIELLGKNYLIGTVRFIEA